MLPRSSVPSLLNNRVSSMNSQSWRSFECERMSSLTVSRNSEYTLVCVSINILRNRSRTCWRWLGVSDLPSLRYCVRLVRPSLRSAQCVDEQYKMIESIFSMGARKLSSLLRDPFQEPDCRMYCTKLELSLFVLMDVDLRPVDDTNQNCVRSIQMTLRFRRIRRGRSFGSSSYVTYRRKGRNHRVTVCKCIINKGTQ